MLIAKCWEQGMIKKNWQSKTCEQFVRQVVGLCEPLYVEINVIPSEREASEVIPRLMKKNSMSKQQKSEWWAKSEPGNRSVNSDGC